MKENNSTTTSMKGILSMKDISVKINVLLFYIVIVEQDCMSNNTHFKKMLLQTEYKNHFYAIEILIPNDKYKEFKILFFKAADKNGTDVDKNNLIAYMQNNGIKLQCYFYLTDFIENKTAIRPDGLCVFRAFFIAQEFKHDRSSATTDLIAFKNMDPDLKLNQKSRSDFLSFLNLLYYKSTLKLKPLHSHDRSYDFAKSTEAKLKKIKNKFNEKDRQYWNNKYNGHFDISAADYGSENELLYVLSGEGDKGQDSFWWIKTAIPDELKNNSKNPNRDNAQWVALEKPLYHTPNFQTPIEEFYNYIDINEMIQQFSSKGFHFLMSDMHAVHVPFPILNKEDVKEILFSILFKGKKM
jgi:hypothetical protein